MSVDRDMGWMEASLHGQGGFLVADVQWVSNLPVLWI